MCGLFAILSQRADVTGEALQRGLAALGHRGPDNRGHWISPRRRVGLAHARLSIVDVTGGLQPLSNEDGSVVVIANGEFYDFERIRRRLEQRDGHRFTTGSDAEIVAHLYESRGEDLFAELRGEFAFVLWDERQGRLIAARDRFGIKPLYHGEVDGNLLFASEAKALFQAGLPAAWDRASVHQQLFGCTAGVRTLFRNVSQVPPGHYLVVDTRGAALKRYWDLDYPRADEPPPEAGVDAVETLLQCLGEAVSLRLKADVPVGCFLSGGLDSSAVLGIAARQSAVPLHAFTVSYHDEAYDESALAAESARLSGAEHQVIKVVPSDYPARFADAVFHAETLAFNLHGIARFIQCMHVRQAGYKAVLSGEGADELLAGYSFGREALQATRSPSTAFEALSAGLGFVPSWIAKLAVSRSIFHLFLRPEFAADFERHDAYADFLSQFDLAQLAGRTPLHKSLYLWNRSTLPNYILAAERLEMAHAVEARLPFLDHLLFEKVRSWPAHLLAADQREKHLLREAVRPLLTQRVYHRSKQPFSAPLDAATPGSPFHEFLQDTVRSAGMKRQPFFDEQAVIDLLDHPQRHGPALRRALDAALLAIASAGHLQDRFQPA